MRKIIAITITTLLSAIFIFSHSVLIIADEPHVELPLVQEPVAVSIEPIILAQSTKEVEEIVEEEFLSDEDIALIALVTMAEAESECEKGKRLVIDTILNRIDSEHFPDNAYDVIYQPSQFSSMWDGRIDCCEVREDICQLVIEEGHSRINNKVIFFTAGEYSKYGVPMFQVENHYFSSYE